MQAQGHDSLRPVRGPTSLLSLLYVQKTGGRRAERSNSRLKRAKRKWESALIQSQALRHWCAPERGGVSPQHSSFKSKGQARGAQTGARKKRHFLTRF